MQPQTVERTTAVVRFKAAHLSAILTVAAGLLLSASQVLAESDGPKRACDLAGTWYGGSIVAYHMTIIPAVARDHYTVFAEGMYKNSVMNTVYTGSVTKKHNRFEGPLMQLSTQDPAFLGPPEKIGATPDINAVWSLMKLVDCNTIQNTIPFFGIYFGGPIGESGIVWVPPGKIPLLDPPDFNLLIPITGGAPIRETYHRLLKTINPALLPEN
jgi:hypothetical protein